MQLPVYITNISILYIDLKPLIYSHIYSEWQQEWDSQPNNKLHKTYPNVHRIPPLSSQFSPRDQVVYNRLRIVFYTRQPLCIPCHSFFDRVYSH